MATAPALLHPLDEFYASAGHALPEAEAVTTAALPQAPRDLLAAAGELTPRLERRCGHPLGLRVLARRHANGSYARLVGLVPADGGRPVALGAVKLTLDGFEAALQARILAERAPLGVVLRDAAAIERRSEGLVRVRCDALLATALALDDGVSGAAASPAWLYGRRSRLFDEAGHPLASILELLPPSRSRRGLR